MSEQEINEMALLKVIPLISLGGKDRNFNDRLFYTQGAKDCNQKWEEKLRWTHVFEELPDLNSVIELKSENKRFLGIVKLKNYQGENRYYVQGMYHATGDIDILYNFSHWRKAIL